VVHPTPKNEVTGLLTTLPGRAAARIGQTCRGAPADSRQKVATFANQRRGSHVYTYERSSPHSASPASKGASPAAALAAEENIREARTKS